MREINKSDIERYVHRVSLHPFENIDELAKTYFEGASPSMVNKTAVIPELLNIPLTKRALLVNIVRERANYDISPVAENKMNVIRQKGEALEPIYKPVISVVKEVDEEEIQSPQ